MKPGRELDALVAEKVMGWDCNAYFVERPGRKHYFDPVKGTFHLYEQWCPSEDIAAAWEVVEKIGKDRSFTMTKLWGGPTTCGFDSGGDVSGRSDVTAKGKTVPHAICLAALKAVE